jgi:clan AA aspartic protease (TIGR02281 family)
MLNVVLRADAAIGPSRIPAYGPERRSPRFGVNPSIHRLFFRMFELERRSGPVKAPRAGADLLGVLPLRTGPVVLALLVASSGAAEGEIYDWVDPAGGIHFTEDLERVPRAEREQALERARRRAPSRLQTFGLPAALDGRPSAAAAAPLATRSLRMGPDAVLRIPFTRSGTLMLVEVVLNDQVQAPFLIDTGASGISIPDAVARRLGVRIDADTPRIPVQTAAGIVAEPLIELDSVQVGPARVEGLEALVNSSMEVGLLGGTFFNNFVYEVDAAAGVITLRPNEGVRGGLSEEQWRERFRSARGELERLERYVGAQDEGEPRRPELERNLRGLRDAWDSLQREANEASVPRSWRE